MTGLKSVGLFYWFFRQLQILVNIGWICYMYKKENLCILKGSSYNNMLPSVVNLKFWRCPFTLAGGGAQTVKKKRGISDRLLPQNSCLLAIFGGIYIYMMIGFFLLVSNLTLLEPMLRLIPLFVAHWCICMHRWAYARTPPTPPPLYITSLRSEEKWCNALTSLLFRS